MVIFSGNWWGQLLRMVTISRRSLIATGLAAGTTAVCASAFAQSQMTANKMQELINYTLKRNKADNKAPTQFSKVVTPILFGRTDASLWTESEAAKDFARQMSYWAGRSTT